MIKHGLIEWLILPEISAHLRILARLSWQNWQSGTHKQNLWIKTPIRYNKIKQLPLRYNIATTCHDQRQFHTWSWFWSSCDLSKHLSSFWAPYNVFSETYLSSKPYPKSLVKDSMLHYPYYSSHVQLFLIVLLQKLDTKSCLTVEEKPGRL